MESNSGIKARLSHLNPNPRTQTLEPKPFEFWDLPEPNHSYLVKIYSYDN